MQIKTIGPVLVTGATGYVAGRLIEKLLGENITVHAAVRDINNKEKLKYLNKLQLELPGKIIFFEADLLKSNSYLNAMKDCKIVFHTASPFKLNVKNNYKDLILPALEGTKNVLDSVNKTESVKRVVLTSSVAAIYGDNIDIERLPDKILTENNWNTTSTLKHQPYYYSKTLAEKEAQKIALKQNRWQLISINPSLVIGPGINPYGTSESFNTIKQLADGTMKFGAPDFSIGTVDIKDVAEAHFKAAYYPNASGRYIISAKTYTILEISAILQEKYGNNYPFPKKEIPKFIVWLLGSLTGFSKQMISKNIGYKFNVDNTKSINELNMNYRPVKDAVIDFFEQISKRYNL